MNDALLALLACPACQGSLTQDDDLLRCGCGLVYPIVDGIPRIFVGEMRSVYAREFPDVVRKHPELQSGDAQSEPTRKKLETRESFGYEWNVYDQMLPSWEKNARFYFETVGIESLRGKRVLDAGCGMGRHAHHAAKAGAQVIALDFSRALEVARRNCAGLDVSFVQADLTAPPLRRQAFDLVYSFGVLHHLPAPEQGFGEILKLVKPGGRIAIYLYHWPEGQPVKEALLGAVSAARRITTRLPHPVLRALSAPMGIGLYAGVVLPFRLLSAFPPTRSLAEKMPLTSYAEYPLHVIINDQFDRFSAPIENRYRERDVRAWLERAGLEEITLLPGHGWRAAGRTATSDRHSSGPKPPA
jgi:SAM-dependent methyltransferase/uncharacterized protein YbaR (Trm112 family)